MVYFYVLLFLVRLFNPIQDGECPPTSFFPVTSTNVAISPQNFVTFSFHPFGVKLQCYIYFQFQIVELEPSASLKNCFFKVTSLEN